MKCLAISDRIRELLDRHYSGPVTGEYSVSMMDNNPNLYVITAGGQKKILKRNWLMTPDRLPKLEELLVRFCDAGITPRVYQTVNGSFHFQEGGDTFCLMDCLDTGRMNAYDCLEQTARLLADMHCIMAGTEHDDLRAPLEVDYDELSAVLKKNSRDSLLPLIDRATEAKGSVRRQLVHNDLQPGNFIRETSGKVYVIDFDSYSSNYLVTDLLFAAFRLGRGDFGFIHEFVKAYDSFNPLTDEERKYGFLFLSNDFARKIGFILREKGNGNAFYMKDLNNYTAFYQKALDMMNAGHRLPEFN